jgi:NADH-quinone oxidoreductase subunit J
MAESILFYLFGAIALTGAGTVIMARNPVYSALGMMSTLFSFAVFYIAHLAHFVAAVQVIVYAGAVMTLFLFVIMLIGVDRAEVRSEELPTQRRLVWGVLAVVLTTAAVVFNTSTWSWVTYPLAGQLPPVNGTIQNIAADLFTIWVLPFEAISLLLIIASIGAVVLAFFKPRPRKET